MSQDNRKKKLTPEEQEVLEVQDSVKFTAPEIKKGDEIKPEEELKQVYTVQSGDVTKHFTDETYTKVSYGIDKDGTKYYYKDDEGKTIDYTVDKAGKRTTYVYTPEGKLDFTEKEGLKTRYLDTVPPIKSMEELPDGSKIAYDIDGHKSSMVDKDGLITIYNKDETVRSYRDQNKRFFTVADNGEKTFYTDYSLKKVDHYETKDGQIFTLDEKGEKTFYKDAALKEASHKETKEGKCYTLDEKGNKTFYKNSDLQEIVHKETKEGQYYTEDKEGNKTFYKDEGKTVAYYQSKDGKTSPLTPKEDKELEALVEMREKGQKLSTKEQLKYDAYSKREAEWVKASVKFSAPVINKDDRDELAGVMVQSAEDAWRQIDAVNALDRARGAVEKGKDTPNRDEKAPAQSASDKTKGNGYSSSVDMNLLNSGIKR